MGARLANWSYEDVHVTDSCTAISHNAATILGHNLTPQLTNLAGEGEEPRM